MNDKLNGVKIALTAFFGALGEFLGWKGILLTLLAVCMALDYISGSLAAAKGGEWSSKIAREGLFHKGGIILVVSGALVADAMFTVALPVLPVLGNNPGVFLPLVLVWYIITEIGSVLENAVKMGASYPKWFLKAIEKAKGAVEQQGEK